MAHLHARCRLALDRGERVLIGFDFPFGYPAGAARALTGQPGWQALWRFLAAHVEDGPDNRSNRFALAARLNQALPAWPRYWGHPHRHAYPGLTAKKPHAPATDFAERRTVEARVRSAKPVWQMCYTGAVGAQAMLGIARLQALRTDPALAPHIAVWPFQTRFAQTLGAPIVLAEIYPSLYPLPVVAGMVKDRLQVQTVAARFDAADRDGTLGAMLAEPGALTPGEREAVLAEEGWIVGV